MFCHRTNVICCMVSCLDWCFVTGRTVLEVLQDFKSAQPPLEWLLQTVPHLKPRQFSIASSLTKHRGSAHITMAVVDYRTPYKRRKLGVCSSWLASLSADSHCAPETSQSQSAVRPDASHAQMLPASHRQHKDTCIRSDTTDSQVHNEANTGRGASQSVSSLQTRLSGPDFQRSSDSDIDPQHFDAKADMDQLSTTWPVSQGLHTANRQSSRPLVPVWVERGVLHLPPSHSTPMIMVGPGTGVAPFKSFLEERQALAVGNTWSIVDQGLSSCQYSLAN